MSLLSSASSSFLIRLAGRGAVRPVGAVVVAVLIAAVGLVAAAPSQVAQAAPPVKAAKVDSRPDLLSARVAARAQGSRVEVESQRAGTSSTWVNPDGTLTTEQHQGPIRFRGKDGAWRNVDLSMAESPDGSVGPRGHGLGLRLKGASATASGAPASATETDVVSVSEPGKSAREVVLAWPGRVGKPVLDGEKATYGEVQPGVDLVVESRRSGFEQLLVVKSAAALTQLQTAAKDGVVSWSLPLKTKGLAARAETDGSVSFVDAKGVVVSRFVAPTAWDAKIDPSSGDHTSTSAVEVSVAQQGKGGLC